MQGNKEVDVLMIPVLVAIKRHISDGSAITDIYNRAYEAVMRALELNVSGRAGTATKVSLEIAKILRGEK